MSTPLLVVTPSPSFGETIRAALEETESYRVFVVSNKVPAIVRAEEESCRMAFLDMDLGEQWVDDIGKALRTVVPNMKLFILAGDETPPPLDGLRPWTLIRKPMHLPEVLSALARPSAQRERPKPQTSPHGKLPWLSDAKTAAQHLTRLTLESSSQAALITRDNEVWAYAGELSQGSAQEVAAIMSRNWDSETDGDLLRFARLETTRAEHILYATRIGRGTLLGLVFDAETPFGTIRSQAGKLGSLLERDDSGSEGQVVSTTPLTWRTSENTPPVSIAPSAAARETPVAEVPAPPAAAAAPEAEVGEGPEAVAGTEAEPPAITSAEQSAPPSVMSIASETPPSFSAPTAALTSEVEDEDEEAPIPPIREILRDIPTPEPPVTTVESGETRRSEFARPQPPPQTLARGETAAPTDLAETVVHKPVQPRIEPAREAAPPVATPPVATPTEKPASAPKAGEVEATLPHSMVGFAGVGADARRIVLEPVSAGVYHLTYACLLVPRFGEHYLTGEVADKLSEWMPIICVAFGWRLEYLAVRPEYLQWVANVAPATSPGYVMRVMRQSTSERIFAAFPGLQKDNPSGDFWAPGYLIMGGAQPHPSQLVKDYIKQVRQRQGSEKPKR